MSKAEIKKDIGPVFVELSEGNMSKVIFAAKVDSESKRSLYKAEQ